MPGMPLRTNRILRYVTAFCPACHAAEPERPLTAVRRLGGYLAEADDRVCSADGYGCQDRSAMHRTCITPATAA